MCFFFSVADDTMCGDPEQPLSAIANRTSTSTVEYSCLKGYRMEGGERTRTCSPKGVWQGHPPRCLGEKHWSSKKPISQKNFWFISSLLQFPSILFFLCMLTKKILPGSTMDALLTAVILEQKSATFSQRESFHATEIDPHCPPPFV